MQQQHLVIGQLEQVETNLRKELQLVQKNSIDELQRYYVDEQTVIEAQQKLVVAELAIEEEKKRNLDLRERCDELSVQTESERKLRSV